MIEETIDLFSYFSAARAGAAQGTLRCYRHGQIAELHETRIRPAMLVIPGGGYGMLSEREAEPVCLRYFAAGFDCFLLQYDVAPHAYPVPLVEAAMAMLYLRRERAALRLGRIFAAGFSAGGHLAGCLAFLFRDAAIAAQFGADCDMVRPDAAVLAYPVVTSDARYWHRDSFVNFCGGDAARFDAFSLERHIPDGAPPVFVWTTGEDTLVPPENSLLLYAALRKKKIPAELHIFECGEHGLSTADAESNNASADESVCRRAAAWVPLSLAFLRAHGASVQRA